MCVLLVLPAKYADDAVTVSMDMRIISNKLHLSWPSFWTGRVVTPAFKHEKNYVYVF